MGHSTGLERYLSHEPRDLGAATSNQGQSNEGSLLAILDGEAGRDSMSHERSTTS